MRLGRVIAAGIVFAVISLIIHTIESFLSLSYYFLEEYFPVWSKIMMPIAGPPPAEFYYYSIGFAVITGVLIAAVYSVVKNGIPGESIRKGLNYGFLLFLAAIIPSALSMILLINLPLELITIWTISNLVIYLIAGVAIQKIVK